MGYKLAGFNVLGGVEIDPRMMAIYRANHHPKHSYLMGVEQFAKTPRDELPPELLNLDVLDGSPPCSSFSTAGSREKAWGEKKKFREGQAEQVLDDLFFHFIDVAKLLQPRVVVAENVKGLIVGKARGYVKQIFAGFAEAGYETQLFLLNAAAMGVPQARERTFFLARRRDLSLPPIKLAFNEPQIAASTATAGVSGNGSALTPERRALWERTKPGHSQDTVDPNGNGFTKVRVHPDRPAPTVTSAGDIAHWAEPRSFSAAEIVRLQSFPDDYNFGGEKAVYVCGMSVPPLMMRGVAREIRKLWFPESLDGSV